MSTVGYNQTATLIVLDDICRQLRSAGIIPVLATLLPRNDAADDLQQKWNVGLRACGDRNGLPVLDMGPALLTTTGVRDAALCSDNVHPNVSGHTSMTKRAAADPIVDLFARTHFTSKVSGDASNLIPRARSF